MEKISFRSFCNRLGYAPNGDNGRTLSALAAVLGVHNSYISKLYSEGDKLTERSGPAFDIIKSYMAERDYELDYLPSETREKLNKQVEKSSKDNIFNVTLQKEYTKLNNKYDSLVQNHRELERKYKELERCFMNTISEDEANKLRKEIKFYKQKFIDLNNLIEFARMVNQDA